ncbi:MAG TPA: hypothetical protein VMU19_08590 [Bryobacteraceae bacterium]|nr:hypothetical protein [Bryobacteraceae bacterium]
MPFCSQCGNAVGGADRYCGRCGASQPPAGHGAPPQAGDPFGSITPRTASILCYIPWVGWIAAIAVLASEHFRHNRDIRFHAFQGLYLFVASLMNQWVLRQLPWPLPHVALYGLVQVALLIMAIFMMVKAAHEEVYSLPLFGELAARSVEEN